MNGTCDGTAPVLLISASIGVTPVLSMLHQLAGSRSEREICWLYGHAPIDIVLDM